VPVVRVERRSEAVNTVSPNVFDGVERVLFIQPGMNNR